MVGVCAIVSAHVGLVAAGILPTHHEILILIPIYISVSQILLLLIALVLIVVVEHCLRRCLLLLLLPRIGPWRHPIVDILIVLASRRFQTQWTG